jgi:hypothetical protein
MLLWGKEETTSLRSLEYMLPLLRGETTHRNKRSKENTHINERSNVEPSLEDRPLVEEREEFFALSREEEKAV